MPSLPEMSRRIPNGEAARYLREVVLAYDGEGCIQWPYGKVPGGYGKIWHQGKSHLVHRIVCEKTNGPPPTPRHVAAHECGNGHNACVAKRHLRWKTYKENELDKVAHGTAGIGEKNGNAKITKDQAMAIRTLKGSASQREIARQFGIKQTQVWRIQHSESWAHG